MIALMLHCDTAIKMKDVLFLQPIINVQAVLDMAHTNKSCKRVISWLTVPNLLRAHLGFKEKVIWEQLQHNCCEIWLVTCNQVVGTLKCS